MHSQCSAPQTLSCFLAAISILLLLFSYIGLFYKPRVSSGPSIVSQTRIAYKFYEGNYKNCGSHFSDILQLCPDKRTLGIYYDDPKKVILPTLLYSQKILLRLLNKVLKCANWQSRIEFIVIMNAGIAIALSCRAGASFIEVQS